MDKLLSLCMIVKNEDKLLKRCLESAKGLVDEIIIVDTGSTDRTKEIALAYTPYVFDFVWIDDFSAAKNAAIRRASGKWILVLDADEYVQPNEHDKLRAYLAGLNADDPLGIVLPIMNFLGNSEQDKNRMIESSAARLFLNHPNLYYSRPIHEQLTYRNGKLKLIQYPFIIFHSGYTAEVRENKKKSNRNLAIFEKLRHKSRLEPYDCFTLANEYHVIQKYDKAIYYYQKAYDRAKPTDTWYTHCLDRMIQTLFSLRRYKEACDLIDNGLERWNNLSDYHCLKGMLLDHFGFYAAAKQQFEICILLADEAEKAQRPYWLISPDYGRLFPYQKLAEIYSREQNLPQTVHYLTKALQQQPNNMNILYQLAEILAASEDSMAITAFFEKLYPFNNPMNARMLFHIFIMIGHAELSTHYYEYCRQNHAEPEPVEMLRYALLTRNREKFTGLLREAPELIDNSDLRGVLFAAGCLWREEYEPSSTGNGELNQDTIKANFSLLIDLYRLQLFEEFDRLFGEVSSPNLIHALADYFYAHHQVELALDYYAYLLEHGVLQAAGYQNFGMWHINQEKIAEGMHFLQEALSSNSDNLALYGLILTNAQDQKLKDRTKAQFVERFPTFKNISFIQQA